jgi:hypothetical protein
MSSDEVQETTAMVDSTKVVQKRTSIMDKIKEKQNDQDFQQKLGVGITLILEIYRVLMGALLIAFVPQNCNGQICSMSENLTRDDVLAKTAVGTNFTTLGAFLILYYIEVKRENKMINYLEVNRFTPVDNESVGECLEKLPIAKRNKLLQYDYYYQTCGYVSTIAFVLNAVFSIITIYNHYLDSKTLTVLLTNLLFMGSKVSDVFSTVNTKKNVFYSAYLKNKVQYNDVDPDKIHLLDEDGEPKVEELPEEEDVEVEVEVTDSSSNGETPTEEV